ncbi:hypothetical protein [Rhizobium phage RHph_X2_30]|nr:hypothetical protein [Rhizobium phage RHph_X2_30]
MSLEEALNRNSEAVEKQNSLLEKMLAKTGAAPSTKSDDGEGESKPATRGKGKGKAATKEADADNSGEGDGENSDDTALSHDDVKKQAGAWLGEFKADENDPETEARRAAIKTALGKLTNKEGATIADVPAAELPRVVAWLDKQKEKDNGFGKGRLTEKPGSKKADKSEDDEI